MIVIDSTRRSQSLVRPLGNASYAVIGLVANTSVYDRGTENERTVTTYIPCVGKIENDNIVAVAACHRSDIMTRNTPIIRASDNKEFNNSGSFVELVDSLVTAMPAGVQPDIYWALKVLPEIRKHRFVTTATSVTCVSERTKRRYSATVYDHKIVAGTTAELLSSQAKRKAVQVLATKAGLGTIEGLDASQTIQFADNSAPETALAIDTDRFVPQSNS